MSATGAPQPMAAPDLGPGGLLFVDVKIRSALIAEGRRRAVTRLFGISRDDQSWLVTTILFGAGAMVARDAVAGRLRRPSGSDMAMGGALLNAMGRGLAGAPSSGMPLAGGLIALAVLSRAIGPAVAESARGVKALGHEVRGAFGTRYVHHGVPVDHEAP